jgi:segregation and condensation protein B
MSTDFQQLRLLEALLFASAAPLGPEQLARHLPEPADLDGLLEELSRLYAERGVNLVRVGERWAFRTAADLAPMMRIKRKSERKLSRAALETLAIVAYHQPVTRGEIEEIRGVAVSKGTLDTLLEAGWVKPKGRRRTPGRPVTWGTSAAFLDHFGLESLDALPGIGEPKAAGLLDSRPAIVTRGARALLAEDLRSGADEAKEDELRGEDPWNILSSEFGQTPGGEHTRSAKARQGREAAELSDPERVPGDEG